MSDFEAFLSETANGRSMRSICKEDGMPSRWQVQERLRTDRDFASQYARACEMRADEVFDEMLDIADDKEGEVNHRRLQVDTRKWVLSRMAPKKYGDKLAIGGADDLPPVQTEDRTAAEIIRARLDAIRSRTTGDADGK